MATNLIDNILREQAFKNERTVAIFRFGFFSLSLVLDALAYLGMIRYTEIHPTIRTILLDSLVAFISGGIFLLLFYQIYHDAIKFIAITFDYSFIALMLIFDPTIPKGGQLIYWVSLVASLFLFLLNLLRYSKSGAIYSSILTIALFIGVSSYYNKGEAENLIPMLFNLILLICIGYFLTSSSRKMMEEANTKKMMERYLPPQLIEELYKKNVNIEPGGETKKVTILFSDIRSFTSISESMPPNEIVNLLNGYLSAMTDIIFQNRGTIDKFIGDAIMTIFGAPIKNEDDAIRAVKTAIDMKTKLEEYNSQHTNLSKPLEIGIGIHTGEVIAGNIGSTKRLDYTVIGDNVNLASRIENLTKFFGCPILISQTTVDELKEEIANSTILTREVDTVIVKGKSYPIKIYEVLSFKDDSEEKEMIERKTLFEHGLALYKESKFEEAILQFKKLEKDYLSELYIQRCKDFLINPPSKNWDGIYNLKSK